MRRTVWLLAFTLGLTASASAADDWAACTLGDSSDQIVAACSRVLTGGKLEDSRRATAYRHRGSAYSAGGDTSRAIADFTQAIRLEPRNAESFVLRAAAYPGRHEPDQAIRDFSEAIRLDPRLSGAFNDRGALYLQKGDYGRAIADFNAAIALDATDARMFVNRGLAYSESGNFDRAMTDFNEAIRLDPKFPGTFQMRGRAYAAKGDYRQAIEEYTKAIRLDPNNAIYFNDRGSAHLDQNDEGDALLAGMPSDARSMLAGNPLLVTKGDDMLVYIIDQCSGKARLQEGPQHDKDSYQLAIADFTQAIALDPNYIFAFANRGHAYTGICQYDRAIGDYNQAVRLDPHNARWLYQRGLAKLSKSDKAGGRRDIEAAKKMNPRVANGR